MIGQSITAGWQCPTGILTSSAQEPSARTRRPFGVQGATGGCDDNGFPIPSPLPSPPAPTPVPLAAVTTKQIVAPGYTLAAPPIAGWRTTLVFPACPVGTCDAGTSNGTIALDALPSASATTDAFDLVFRNAGPEDITPPPSAADNPAPHIWNLYGPPVPAGQPLEPVAVYVSGAPATIGFPSLVVTIPSGSPLDPRTLRLTIVQSLTPPTYEEAIFTENFLAPPLASTSPPYAPATTTSTTASFTLPSTPFPFQTDFTEYDFVVASG